MKRVMSYEPIFVLLGFAVCRQGLNEKKKWQGVRRQKR